MYYNEPWRIVKEVYEVGKRQQLKIKFLGRDEIGAKIYKDEFGNTIYYPTGSKRLEEKDKWYTITAKVTIFCVDAYGDDYKAYEIFNPREIKNK